MLNENCVISNVIQLFQTVLIVVSIVAAVTANGRYSYHDYKAHQPTSYDYQKNQYNQPSYGHDESHSYQPTTYEPKGYGNYGYQQPKAYGKQQYSYEHAQPASYDKGHTYQPYDNKGSSYGYDSTYEQPKSYGSYPSTYWETISFLTMCTLWLKRIVLKNHTPGHVNDDK